MHQVPILALGLGLLAAGLWSIPWREAQLRRRAAWLLLLPVPALAMLALGPVGLIREPYGETQRTILLQAQTAGAVVSALLAVGLVAVLARLRQAALIFGAMAVFITLGVAGLNQLIIAPGS